MHEKPIYRGDCLKRGGLDSLQIQGEGGLARNRGGRGLIQSSSAAVLW